jgi:hypothetical protein
MARRVLALLWVAAIASASEFSGCVQSSVSGAPISGAIVTLGSKVTRTDQKGQFQILGEGTGIGVRACGFGRSFTNVDGRGVKSLKLELTPVTPRALYLSFWAIGTPPMREAVLKLAATTPVNAVVIDIKGDRGFVSFRSGVALAAEIGAQKIVRVPDMPALIHRLHKEGIYTIGRIVTFKDNVLGTAKPKLAVHRNGMAFKDREGLTWVDPFLADVRKYNIDLAVSAAAAGFDEIQFDYVRFPDAKGVEFSEPSTEESRPRAITDFLKQARDKLVPYNVFLAADVFGYICWNAGDTGIGQDITRLSSVLDYISPMLYPSGFLYGIPKYRDAVAHPYEIVRSSLDRARERTGIDAVRFRPWLQAFADYAFDKRQFGRKEIQAQIQAAESFGADGWILWNARNVYTADNLRRPALMEASKSIYQSPLPSSK